MKEQVVTYILGDESRITIECIPEDQQLNLLNIWLLILKYYTWNSTFSSFFLPWWCNIRRNLLTWLQSGLSSWIWRGITCVSEARVWMKKKKRSFLLLPSLSLSFCYVV